MLDCSSPPARPPPLCPNCRHEYSCCPPPPTFLAPTWTSPSPPFCAARRRLHVLSGGGVVETAPQRPYFDFDDPPAFDDDEFDEYEPCDDDRAHHEPDHASFAAGHAPFAVGHAPYGAGHAPFAVGHAPFGQQWAARGCDGPLDLSKRGAVTPPMFVQPEEEEPPLPLPRPPPVVLDREAPAGYPICPLAALQLFNETVNKLRHSGWFHDLRSESSNEELKGLPAGAFFVRPSADAGHLFALSVQTERGPTSVRFTQVNGHFRLEAMPDLKENMPLFRRLPDLIQFYVLRYQVIKEYQANLSSDDPIHKKLRDLLEHRQGAWVDENGKFYGYIRIERPHYRGRPPSLRHFARLAINAALTDRMRPAPVGAARHAALPLPRPLVDYLREYPYCV